MISSTYMKFGSIQFFVREYFNSTIYLLQEIEKNDLIIMTSKLL